MNILIDVGHPKDVNVLKNVIIVLQSKGHKVKIVARDKENMKGILDAYGFKYELCKHHKSYVRKIFGIVTTDLCLYRIAKIFNPDIFVGPVPYAAHVSKLFKRPFLIFPDTEIANFLVLLSLPFITKIYTPACYDIDIGEKHKRFNGYLEMSYLHPKYFTPKKEVLNKYGLKVNGHIIIRLALLSAHHDANASGFSFKTEDELKKYIEKLEKYGKVIIFSETTQWQTIKDYQLEIDPKDLHDILYYSKLYIGEGATMASEAAILGVPAIYVSNTWRGYLDELEDKYDLAYTISNKDDAFKKALSLLQVDDIKEKWHHKREKMLGEVIDTVEFMVDVIEEHGLNYENRK